MRFVLLVALHFLILAVGLWDVVAAARGRHHDTISIVVMEWSRAFPIIPLILGLVLGHLFWPQHVPVHVLPSSQ
jgi:hypothetical protein